VELQIFQNLLRGISDEETGRTVDKGVQMKILLRIISKRMSLLKGMSMAVLVLSFASAQAVAQGPAGAGAAGAAGGGSATHSYNPLKWIGKKDAKPTGDAPVANVELDQKLETKLRNMQVLSTDTTLKQACGNFLQRVDCLAALHASHNVGLNFECVKSNVTGVRVGTDTSSCRMPAGDKPLSLAKTIKLLKPDADAKAAAKDAEGIARQELSAAGA
jgi:opacity protein-like surface antigen